MKQGRNASEEPTETGGRFPDAAVVQANTIVFEPGQVLDRRAVLTRSLVWNKSGRGSLTIDGERFEPREDELFAIPWNHDLVCRAAEREPFLLGGICLVPVSPRAAPFAFGAEHGASGARVPGPRQDRPVPGCDGLVTANLRDHLRLGFLLEYCVQRFLTDEPTEWMARQLGQLLMEELVELGRAGGAALRLPAELVTAQRWLRERLAEAVELSDLADELRLSRSTVERWFRRHCGCAPGEWLRRERLRKAKELLLTTAQPVGEVGYRVGYPDPFHFSKLFKRHVGQSPRAFREQAHWSSRQAWAR